MPIHDPENYTQNDCINAAIWRCSPGLQRQLAGQFPVNLPGSCGGQQAMFAEEGPGSPDQPLPWVPDLVGKESMQENGVMVIGSSYAGFVQGFGNRGYPLDLYIGTYENGSYWQFQEGFLKHVIEDDPNYYNPVAQLFEPVNAEAGFNWERLLLTDWCRASFVQRNIVGADGIRHDAAGDNIATRSGAFPCYIWANLAWHVLRFQAGDFRRVILLGNVAHYWIHALCRKGGWSIQYQKVIVGNPDDRIIPPPVRVGQFWDGGKIAAIGILSGVAGRDIQFVVVPHPAALGGYGGNVRTAIQQWLELDHI